MYVKLFGEFLDRTTSQLPKYSRTVALIFNVKPEASPQPSLTPDQAPIPFTQDFFATASVASSGRLNDMYSEWDTMETVNAVRVAIEERYEVVMIEADEEAFQKLLEIRPFFAFNIAEGLFGSSRESQIPAMLEMLQIPYLGSDPLSLGICLDKARAKEILAYHNMPTAPFSVVRSLQEFEDVRVRFPSIVKPLHEGSSKGVYNSCLVRNIEELEREVRTTLETYNQPVLVEEFLPGREFTVAVMGNGDGVRILPIVEIAFAALPPGMNPIYSYEAKWVWDTTDKPLDIYDCPAKLDPSLQGEIETLCKDTYRVLNCRDWSRIDVRLDSHGRPHIIEVNPLPGILPNPKDNSCFPKAARAAGMSYNQLINSVLDIAMERSGLPVPARRQQEVAMA